MKMRTKYILTFVCIFLIVFSIGVVSILSLSNTLKEKDINNINFVVKDKYVINNDDKNPQYYIVSSDNNTYEANDVGVYQKVKKNKNYAFVTYGNRNINKKKYPVIVEVHPIDSSVYV